MCLMSSTFKISRFALKINIPLNLTMWTQHIIYIQGSWVGKLNEETVLYVANPGFSPSQQVLPKCP